MKDKEKMKKLGAAIDKEFEKIKRKALKMAPVLAAALPGGATLATALYAYNQHLAAIEFGKQVAVHASDTIILENFANHALNYVRAVAIGDEKEIERTGDIVEQMFRVGEFEEKNILERYFGEDGPEFIHNLISSTQKNALDETAIKYGFENGAALAQELNKNPALEAKVRDEYMNNLFDQTEISRTELWEADLIQEGSAAFNEAATNMAEASENATIGTGLSVALAAATMAVTMVVVNKHQKLVQKLEQEAKAMDTKKTEPEMER